MSRFYTWNIEFYTWNRNINAGKKEEKWKVQKYKRTFDYKEQALLIGKNINI